MRCLKSSAMWRAPMSIPSGNDRMHAVVCVLTFPDLQLLEVAHAIVPVTFPYVPGLLAFRESPAVLAAFEKLRHDPDVALCLTRKGGRTHAISVWHVTWASCWICRPSVAPKVAFTVVPMSCPTNQKR
jgi:deoxyinosine 3'endonuclease (endonuclease V)